MPTAIGASLPYALAAALSPIPITAVTLILLARRGLASGLFTAGRFFAYALILTLVVIGSELIHPGTDVAPSPAGEIARFVLGAAAIGAGIWTWLRRSAEKSERSRRWVRAVTRVTAPRSAALGFALSAGPKNWLLLAGGGLAIAGARVSWAGEALAGLVFVAVAASTAAVPVVLYYAIGARALNALQSLQDWMQTNGAAISSVLLVVVGVVLVGSGFVGLL